jgi:hypothetical protein
LLPGFLGIQSESLLCGVPDNFNGDNSGGVTELDIDVESIGRKQDEWMLWEWLVEGYVPCLSIPGIIVLLELLLRYPACAQV